MSNVCIIRAKPVVNVMKSYVWLCKVECDMKFQFLISSVFNSFVFYCSHNAEMKFFLHSFRGDSYRSRRTFKLIGCFPIFIFYYFRVNELNEAQGHTALENPPSLFPVASIKLLCPLSYFLMPCYIQYRFRMCCGNPQ